MLEIRIHGRGGQGIVTAAELLSVAAFDDGWHAQAFPSFGSERTGAPVVSFCRLSKRPIRVREPIVAPQVLIVVDPTLLHQVDVFAGVDRDGYVLINSSRSFSELRLEDLLERLRLERLRTVPASEIARAQFATAMARGKVSRPLPNAAMLGGFAALTGAVSLEAVTRAIRERFSARVAEANVAAAEHTFAGVRGPLAELEPARA